MKQPTATITEPELDAVFDALLDRSEDRPALDVASMTSDESDAKAAEIEASLSISPTLAENAIRIACSYGADDATVAACVRRFLGKIQRRLEYVAAEALIGGAL